MRFRVEMHSGDGGFWIADSRFWIGFHRGRPSGLGVHVFETRPKDGTRNVRPRSTLREFVAQQLKRRNRELGAGNPGVFEG